LKILILGIGNVLFGDEGIGVHLTNYLDEKYSFTSDEHTVSLIDGGTLAQILIPTITDYDKVVIIDCVNVVGGNIGDVYSFNFDDVPEYITWEGSAHEVEMLQTLQMVEMLGDLPPVKIVGVIPYVIGENSTFTMTDEVLKGSVTMEDTIINYIKELGVEVSFKNKEIMLQDIARKSHLRGTEWY
jgi:hydrogenase maturation protease